MFCPICYSEYVEEIRDSNGVYEPDGKYYVCSVCSVFFTSKEKFSNKLVKQMKTIKIK